VLFDAAADGSRNACSSLVSTGVDAGPPLLLLLLVLLPLWLLAALSTATAAVVLMLLLPALASSHCLAAVLVCSSMDVRLDVLHASVPTLLYGNRRQRQQKDVELMQ